MRLSGRVALVTGGGAGLGKGIALEMAKEGADVAIADIDESRAQQTAKEVRQEGRRAAAICADVSRRGDVDRMVGETINALGTVDILVNNAGISRGKPFLELDDDSWDIVLNTNLKSVFMASQTVARYWVAQGKKGKIVNISSVDEIMPYPFNPHYNASKAGIHIMTESIALALAPHQININSIGPGIHESEMTRPTLNNPKWQAGVPVKIPLGRVGTAADVGKAAVFLASSDADYITGATLYVDGGHRFAAHAQVMKMFSAG
ncbi:MAG: SDR family oxidoreductase [Chloroflexi bacterium]|nr:SDR family oxidoreductase [Chloroflexota bacterium]